MLTDIFANRYVNVPIWQQFGESERRLVVQGFRILSERVCPYYLNGKEYDYGKEFWTDIHSRLSMELGVKSLSPEAYAYNMGSPGEIRLWTGTHSVHHVCETWMLQAFEPNGSADRFIKERLSLVEIAIRKREAVVARSNANLEKNIADARARSARKTGGIRVPGDLADGLIAENAELNAKFKSIVDELNARFLQANCGLHYHNGFIQRSTDALVTREVEAPFWDAVAAPKWKNVDIDMKEACDRRDAAGRDPAFHAARALESTIKIISTDKGWTHGRERGAHNYLDNLSSNGFILKWEADAMKLFFTEVRNPLGHGPGDNEMITLTPPQNDWAIEFCMSCIKSLVKRI